MVDGWTGKWYPEEDYSKYPKEKWCDCDRLCIAIREDNYVPKTSMENLIDMVFAHYEPKHDEFYDEDKTEIENIIDYVRDSGGWKEFDYKF